MYDMNGRHERVRLKKGLDIFGYKCSCGVIYHYFGRCPVCKESTDKEKHIMKHKTLIELAKILDNKTEYDIFVAKNLNNELKEIIIKPKK